MLLFLPPGIPSSLIAAQEKDRSLDEHVAHRTERVIPIMSEGNDAQRSAPPRRSRYLHPLGGSAALRTYSNLSATWSIMGKKSSRSLSGMPQIILAFNNKLTQTSQRLQVKGGWRSPGLPLRFIPICRHLRRRQYWQRLRCLRDISQFLSRLQRYTRLLQMLRLKKPLQPSQEMMP